MSLINLDTAKLTALSALVATPVTAIIAFSYENNAIYGLIPFVATAQLISCLIERVLISHQLINENNLTDRFLIIRISGTLFLTTAILFCPSFSMYTISYRVMAYMEAFTSISIKLNFLVCSVYHHNKMARRQTRALEL
jgi:hypothetical protein